MRLITLLVALLTAAPVFAQGSRLYTNADLGKKSIAWTRTVTAEELHGLEARQFKLPPALPDGPTVIILSNREEPQPLPLTRPLSEPWSLTTYVGPLYGGRSYGGRSGSSHAGPYPSRSGIHPRRP